MGADPGEGDGIGVGELAGAWADEVVAAVGEAVLVDLEEALCLVDVAAIAGQESQFCASMMMVIYRSEG